MQISIKNGEIRGHDYMTPDVDAIAQANGFENSKQMAQVCEGHTFEVDDANKIIDTEKVIFLKYAYADNQKDKTKAAATDAEKAFKIVKAELINYLVAQEKAATARYDGIGFVSLTLPEVRAYVLKENEDKLFEFLKEKGYGAIIKPSVHHATLSNCIDEIRKALKQGEQLPEYINVAELPNCKFYSRP